MLKALHTVHRGFTLIEALVALSILALLLALGAPTFGQWIASVRVRTTAEATLAGLQYARSEATTRNQQVRFQLTTSLDSSCVRSTSGPHWIVDLVETVGTDSVEGQCEAAAGEVNPAPPGILMKRSGTDGSGNSQIVASSDSLVFNGLGALDTHARRSRLHRHNWDRRLSLQRARRRSDLPSRCDRTSRSNQDVQPSAIGH